MLEDIKRTFWATADKLRANKGAAEYKHLVLGLILVKCISDTFAARRAALTTRLTNPAEDYCFANAIPSVSVVAAYENVLGSLLNSSTRATGQFDPQMPRRHGWRHMDV